jgi:hypothetical protein
MLYNIFSQRLNIVITLLFLISSSVYLSDDSRIFPQVEDRSMMMSCLGVFSDNEVVVVEESWL